MGRRTMYAMMGAGAYGCSGVAPTVSPSLEGLCSAKNVVRVGDLLPTL